MNVGVPSAAAAKLWMPREATPGPSNIRLHHVGRLRHGTVSQPKLFIRPKHVEAGVWIRSRYLEEEIRRLLIVLVRSGEIVYDQVHEIGIFVYLDVVLLAETRQLLVKLWGKQIDPRRYREGWL